MRLEKAQAETEITEIPGQAAVDRSGRGGQRVLKKTWLQQTG
jgi:hypothetical protein